MARHFPGLPANPNWFFFSSCMWLTFPSWLITPWGPQQENQHCIRHLLGEQTQLPAPGACFGVETEMQTAAKTTTLGELLLFLLKCRDTFHFFTPLTSTDFTRFLREGNSNCMTQRENHLLPITEMLTCRRGAGWHSGFCLRPWVSDWQSSVTCPEVKHRQEKKQQHQEPEAKIAGLWWTERGFLQETTKPNIKLLIPCAEEVTGEIYNFLHGRGCVGSGQHDWCGQGKKWKQQPLAMPTISHLTCLLHML